MIRLILSVMALAWFSGAASAQFGPKEPTPRTADEIFADRAMETAASFLQTRGTDVVSTEDGVDPERAQFWYSEARKRYSDLCEDRAAPSDVWPRNCFKLGYIYLRGQGTVQDYGRAETLFLTACEQGDHIEACLQQAYNDHVGSAGETDWPRARQLYEKTCLDGSVTGCAGLGNMLYRGQGGIADRARGARLLQGACADEYEWACERLTGFGLPRSTFQ